MTSVKDYLETDKANAREKYEKKRRDKNYSLNLLATLPPIEELVDMSYNLKFITADNISNRQYVKIDNTTGRLHSCLTRLKKDLRNFVKYGGQTLCSIDIINSQPLLSTILLDIELFTKHNIHGLISRYNPRFKPEWHSVLNKKVWYDDISKVNSESKYESNPAINLARLIMDSINYKDVQLFNQLVRDGVFYEEFGLILLENGLIPVEILQIENIDKKEKAIRKYAKLATFTALFCNPQHDYFIKEAQAFKRCFPNVYRIFREVKTGKGVHNTLACILQKFESNLILHQISMRVHDLNPSVLLFTIHDSIVTSMQDEDRVTKVFLEVSAEWLNVEPKIQIEVWD